METGYENRAVYVRMRVSRSGTIRESGSSTPYSSVRSMVTWTRVRISRSSLNVQ